MKTITAKEIRRTADRESVGNAPTLVRSPSSGPRANGAEGLHGQPGSVAAMLTAIGSDDSGKAERQGGWREHVGGLAMLSVLFLPAASPFLAAAAIRRGYKMVDNGGGFTASIAMGVGVMVGLCGLSFWLLWGLMRPVPMGLLTGWAGLRHLPAVHFGFHQTAADPWGFTPGSFEMPGGKPEARPYRPGRGL